MLRAGVGSRVGSTALKMHAFHPALLADAATDVRHDRNVAQTLERRGGHPKRSTAAELPRRTSNARATARHQRPRHAGEHRYSCNRAASHCLCCTTVLSLPLCRAMTSTATEAPTSLANPRRRAVLALLYRSMYRIKEPRQQPNEDSQRGPRPRVGIVVGLVERTQVNDSKLTHRLL